MHAHAWHAMQEIGTSVSWIYVMCIHQSLASMQKCHAAAACNNMYILSVQKCYNACVRVVEIFTCPACDCLLTISTAQCWNVAVNDAGICPEAGSMLAGCGSESWQSNVWAAEQLDSWGNLLCKSMAALLYCSHFFCICSISFSTHGHWHWTCQSEI